MYQQITLRHIEKPRRKDVALDVSWLCDSFGFVTGRDLQRLSAMILFDVVRNLADRALVSSDLIAKDLSVTPARVNHHLRSLMSSGIIYRQRNHIFLKGGSLKTAVLEMRKDANRIFDDLLEIADEVDSAMGLMNRK